MAKKAKKLTKKQITAYLANPEECPYCGSNDIDRGHFEPDGTYINCSCPDCYSTWQEVYKLVALDFREI